MPVWAMDDCSCCGSSEHRILRPVDMERAEGVPFVRGRKICCMGVGAQHVFPADEHGVAMGCAGDCYDASVMACCWNCRGDVDVHVV